MKKITLTILSYILLTGLAFSNNDDSNSDFASYYYEYFDIKKTNSPVITLLGDATITIERGTPYNDAGATANDVEDGDITADITNNISINNPNISVAANYAITYYVVDSDTNSATPIQRAVNVVDTTDPELTPNIVSNLDEGETALGTITANEGVTWTDSSADVSVSAAGVVTLNAGAVFGNTYSFTITGTDVSNNATISSQFSVSVNDITPPVISNLTMVSNNANTGLAKPGDLITLSFTSDEAINAPTVHIAGQNALVSNNGNDWTAIISVIASSAEGYASFSISNISDIAGNFRGDIIVNNTNSSNGVLIDVTAPTGYDIVNITDPVTSANQATFSFEIVGVEVNSSYNWSISDDNYSPSLTGIGSWDGNGQIIITTDISGLLDDGTLTITVSSSDSAGNTGSNVNATTTKDVTPPVIPNVIMISTNPVFTLAKEGDVIQLIFDANETINIPTVTIAGETATVSNTSGNNWAATLTVGSSTTEGVVDFEISNISDVYNNAAPNVSTINAGGVTIDRTAPTGYSITNLTDPVIPSNEATASFEVIGIENPSSYNWSISDGNNPDITGSGTWNGVGQVIISTDVSSLDDGTLTVTVTSTDSVGNTGDAVTATTTKDTNGPVIVLTGDNPQTLELNNIYVEQGVTSVNDNIDGVLDPNNVNINTSALDVTTVGRYNIVYTIDDSRGNTGTAIRVVHVMDTKPTVEDDAVTVLKNSVHNAINVLANDCFGTFGPNTGHSLTLINGKMSIITANGGSIAVENNGTPTNFVDDYISYTPEGDYSGSDTFTYTITDTNGIAATATVTVTVSTTNANGYLPDSFTVAQDSNNNELDVMANDSDDAGFGPTDTRFLIESVDHLTGTTEYGGVVVLNTKGTANDTSDDVIDYTPRAGFFGIDTFRYVPGNNRNDYVLVTVTVTEGTPSLNGTPTAVNDVITVGQDSSDNVINVIGNDTPGTDGYINDGLRMPNGTFGGASTEGGLLTIKTNGTTDTTDDVFEYTPLVGFTGTDTFEYTITDASGDAATGLVTITVTAITDQPLAVNDAANTTKNTLVSIPVIVGDINGVGADSFGTDGRATAPNDLTVSGTSTEGGTVVVNGDNIDYTPDTDFIGEDTFTYTIEDANGDQSTATVTVTVTEVALVNGTPTAVADTETVAQGSTTLFDVLDNDDYGTDGASATHPLTFSNGSTINASTEGGAISVVDDNGTNKISYTPAPGFSGADSIVYVITDLNGDASEATVNITVTSSGIVSTPTAVDDTASVAVGGTILINVLANDSSGSDGYKDGGLTMPNGTLTSASTKGGAISIDNKGTLDTTDDEISYSSFKGAIAGDTDTFKYTITDTSGDASTATVTVSITAAAADVPTAIADSATATENSAETISVLTNDSFGTDGRAATDFLTVGATSDLGGTTVVSGDDIIYTPTTGFKGVDTFSYTIEDSNGDQSTATVTVTVSAVVLVNGTPTADDDSINVERYGWTSADPIIYLDVLANDDFGTDGAMTAHNALNFKGGKLEIVSTEGRRIKIDDNGTALDYSDDRIAYYSTGNLSVTTDSFEYTITDNSGDAATATVTINYLDVAPPKTGDKDDVTTDTNSFVNNEFTAYPNPSQGNVKTTIYSSIKTKAILSLFDVRGVEVYRRDLDLKAGKNDIENNFNVKSGVLFLKVYNAETNFGIKKIIFR